MCVALPGKVIEVKEKYAVVDFDGNIVEARSGLDAPKVGDYVLVHAGCIIQKMTEEDAIEMKELMALMNGNL